jgi:starch synthase
MVDKLKVLFLSPEVVPFAKTGGLADVAGALPGALKRFDVDVRLVLPYYRLVREGNFQIRSILKDLKIPLGSETLTVNVLETQTEDGVPVYLIERDDLYDRPNLYGSAVGDYYDNLERFSFFSHAALILSEALLFSPDLIHCHDWQTGLVPALIKGPYRDTSILTGTPTIFTVHNLGYQGLFPAGKLPVTGLSKTEFFHQEGLEFWGKISLLKAGIVYAQAVTTVSPTYAREIQTPEYGLGMEGILKKRRSSLHGILNGVDYSVWNPAIDSHLPYTYSPRKMEGKRRCKESLIQEMGINPSLIKKPLLGMISRLDNQKGFDLLIEILDEILEMDVGLILLGSGDEFIQKAIQKVAISHKGQVGFEMGFDEPLAHRMMAGLDMFLIPSRYEPCGLTQIYALKYGTVPVVRATGGLDDTIVPFDPLTREGNGFKFASYTADAFVSAIRQAVNLFQDPRIWKRIMANGMKADFSWDKSARRYLEIYRSVV